jgi:hypothetical protein
VVVGACESCSNGNLWVQTGGSGRWAVALAARCSLQHSPTRCLLLLAALLASYAAAAAAAAGRGLQRPSKVGLGLACLKKTSSAARSLFWKASCEDTEAASLCLLFSC